MTHLFEESFVQNGSKFISDLRHLPAYIGHRVLASLHFLDPSSTVSLDSLNFQSPSDWLSLCFYSHAA